MNEQQNEKEVTEPLIVTDMMRAIHREHFGIDGAGDTDLQIHNWYYSKEQKHDLQDIVKIFNDKKKEIDGAKAYGMDDRVNNPKHYTVGGIETIDYIKAKLTPEEYVGYLKGNIIKYTSRSGHKDDALEDHRKAGWYNNKLIEELE